MPIASIFNYIGVIVLVVLVLILVVSNIHVVQQSRAYVVERLGAYSATWNVGLHLKIPFIERVVKKVSLKEQVADFDPQPVITKDNVTMQMKAERERRESILQAEGQKQSQILVAEGEKQSTILKADAEKQAAILHAEAERQAAVLRAEGEAEAIMKVQTALADSIKLLNNANPNDQVVKLKALESFEKAADGQATKIIVPSEIQSLAGLAASFKGLLEDEKK